MLRVNAIHYTRRAGNEYVLANGRSWTGFIYCFTIIILRRFEFKANKRLRQ